MVFRLFHNGEQIKTKANRDNLYMSLQNAKRALRQYLLWVNKKIHRKDLQVKSENCQIIGFELVEKAKHHL